MMPHQRAVQVGSKLHRPFIPIVEGPGGVSDSGSCEQFLDLTPLVSNGYFDQALSEQQMAASEHIFFLTWS